VRIGRIGADRIQVVIRPAIGDTEMLAVVHRLDQLIDAGYDTIDVVFESAASVRHPAPEGPGHPPLLLADGGITATPTAAPGSLRP